MTVESATYISDLNAAYPEATTAVSDGDDHLRLLKTVIKATFPNINSAVTPTDEELNYVDGVTSGIQTQIDSKPTWTTGSGGAATLNAARIQTYTATGDGTTVNLPASPTSGDLVIIAVKGAITVTAGRNGKTIAGTALDYACTGNGINIFVYHDGNWSMSRDA